MGKVSKTPKLPPGAGKVFFGNNNPGEVSDALFSSFVSLIQFDRANGQFLASFYTQVGGACISVYRNIVAEVFLKTDLEWLWFVDSDIQLKDETLAQLMQVAHWKDRPVVGANYFMRVGQNIYTPAMFFHQQEEGKKPRLAARWQIDEDWPRDQLVKVDGVGMGCTLIHRSLLEAMRGLYGLPEPWFAQSQVNGYLYGEDLTFSHRAQTMGYPLYVHTGIEVGHVKSVLLDSTTMALEVKSE